MIHSAARLRSLSMKDLTALSLLLFAPEFAEGQARKQVFFPVKPATASKSAGAGAAELHIGTGRFFQYAMPQGWRVGEDGQFALTLMAPDNKALTVMVGNAGLQPNYPPDRFVYEKLMALRPQNLRLGQPRRAQPVAGFAEAYAFDVSYSVNGVPCQGLAKININKAYDTSVMAMTAALAEARQWQGGYASWLPQVADQISATNGAAFGIRGVMAQNLRNSIAYGEAARSYREWSQKTWQGVTDDRNRSVDQRNEQFRQNLGNVQPYSSPYESKRVDLPNTYSYYWMDPQGNVLGTDDPNANPNQGSRTEWRQMRKSN